MSYRAAGSLGSALGGSYGAVRIPQGGHARNLGRAFPGMPEKEIRTIALGACGYGRALMEMLWSGGAGEDELRRTMTLENPEVPLDALARGKD